MPSSSSSSPHSSKDQPQNTSKETPSQSSNHAMSIPSLKDKDSHAGEKPLEWPLGGKTLEHTQPTTNPDLRCSPIHESWPLDTLTPSLLDAWENFQREDRNLMEAKGRALAELLRLDRQQQSLRVLSNEMLKRGLINLGATEVDGKGDRGNQERGEIGAGGK